jgi:hypothetical protein
MVGKDEPQAPVKVVAMWTHTVLYRADQPQPIRGFGGRLMFYGEKTDKPVKVEGTLTIYAFDETHSKKDDPKPSRKYVFTPDQFSLHYSKSEIGHSYSVWLPWDAASGAPCKVSLIARFMPKQGSLVIGEQSLQLLPGPEGDNPAPTPAQAGSPEQVANPVRPVSHEVEIPARLDAASPAGASPVAAPVGLRSITIPVPIQSRLYGSTAVVPSMNGARPVTLPVTARPAVNAGGATNPAGSGSPALGPSWDSSSDATKSDPRFSQAMVSSRPTRFVPPRFRAQGEPIVPPRVDRDPSPLHREESQLNPVASPGLASGA